MFFNKRKLSTRKKRVSYRDIVTWWYAKFGRRCPEWPDGSTTSLRRDWRRCLMQQYEELGWFLIVWKAAVAACAVTVGLGWKQGAETLLCTLHSSWASWFRPEALLTWGLGLTPTPAAGWHSCLGNCVWRETVGRVSHLGWKSQKCCSESGLKPRVT